MAGIINKFGLLIKKSFPTALDVMDTIEANTKASNTHLTLLMFLCPIVE